MSDLTEMSNTPREVEINDELTLKLCEFELGDLSELEEWTLNQYVKQAIADLGVTSLDDRLAVQRKLRQTPGTSEEFDQLQKALLFIELSYAGMLKKIYLSARHSHPGITEQQLSRMLSNDQVIECMTILEPWRYDPKNVGRPEKQKPAKARKGQSGN